MDEIVSKVAADCGVSIRQAETIVKSFFNHARTHLASGGELRISQFGIFKIAHQAARKGRNPQTGEIIDIPPRLKVSFKGADALNAPLNEE